MSKENQNGYKANNKEKLPTDEEKANQDAIDTETEDSNTESFSCDSSYLDNIRKDNFDHDPGGAGGMLGDSTSSYHIVTIG